MIGYDSMTILRVVIMVAIGINQDGCHLRSQSSNCMLYQQLSHEGDQALVDATHSLGATTRQN
jgi:hypothetical protein